MIYWTDFNPHNIIEDTNITTLAREVNIPLIKTTELTKETRDWLNYARVVSKRNELNVVYGATFIYYVTMFFSDEGVSANAEVEYFKKDLDKLISRMYFDTIQQGSEIEQKTRFFTQLLKFFKGELYNEKTISFYERRIFQHHILVTPEIKQWFSKYDSIGQTVSDLIHGKIEKPHLNMNSDKSEHITFLLPYSEETIWRNISKFGDGDRLRVLLY